ncbi:MAG TPA: hypothetical protein VF476_19455 [Chitinophagaceae bacterium]
MNEHNNDETVVLKIFDDLGAATTAQSKLKEQGIDSFIHDANVMGLDPVAGIELKIFSKDREKAKALLA